MRRHAARLILPPLVSALVVAGCGGEPPGRKDGPANASAARADSDHLLWTPDELPRQLPTDDLPPADLPPADLPPAAGDEAGSAGGCHPSYDPCVPVDSDVDCAGGGGNGPSYVAGPVRVVGSDPFDLDRDGDGIGCES